MTIYDHYLRKELDECSPAVFEHLLRASLDGIWYWDLETPAHEWISPNFWELLGYNPLEKAHFAKEAQDLIHPDDLTAATRNFIAHCADPCLPYDQVIRYRASNGRTVWVRSRGTAIRDRAGNPIRMLGSFNDVTELKLTEERLRRHESQLNSMLTVAAEANAWSAMAEQVAAAGHWRVSLPDWSVTWSREIYRIHGVAPEAYIPAIETSLEFYHPDDREQVQMILAQTAKDGAPFDFLVRVSRADQEFRNVRCRGGAIAGPDKAPAIIFGIFMDVTEQKRVEYALSKANIQLDELAYIDGLTGIPNRRRFDETLEREWRAAARNGTQLSIVMIDVDEFKAYNDCYGHQSGDDCLRLVASAVNSVSKRPYDLVARYGGEELVMLLPETDAVGAVYLAEQARATIEALRLQHAESSGCDRVVTISAGAATVDFKSSTPPADKGCLLAEADAMLYVAKRLGRNRVVSNSKALLSEPTFA